MATALLIAGLAVALGVAIAAFGDARHADSDHPYGSCTDRRDTP